MAKLVAVSKISAAIGSFITLYLKQEQNQFKYDLIFLPTLACCLSNLVASYNWLTQLGEFVLPEIS